VRGFVRLGKHPAAPRGILAGVRETRTTQTTRTTQNSIASARSSKRDAFRTPFPQPE